MRIRRSNLGKVRKGVWIDPYLFDLLQADGIDLTSFVDRALAVYFEVPEDPREALIREKLETVKLRLRSSYEMEMREIIRTQSDQITNEDAEKTREQKKLTELKTLGEYLKGLNFYPKLEKCLRDPDLADDLWDHWIDAAAIISSKNGKKWDENNLWSVALDWWQKYGKARS